MHPPHRYEDPELQAVYASGFTQARDHDSGPLLELMMTAVPSANGDLARQARLQAACLEGIADLYLELADECHQLAGEYAAGTDSE
jgi:hypothetical protein